MKNVYLPIDDLSSVACFVITNQDTIRAYYQTPRQNSTANYVDFYVNSHYLRTSGTQTWGNTSNLPTCVDRSIFTNDIVYSNEFPDGLFIFCVLFFFCIYFPYRLVRRMLGRWLVV